uniref:Uncharacterized protein n=1 Tax=Octopus bimaculoides TaxID=37653 RepID=A0A0L8FSF8_OCTBM
MEFKSCWLICILHKKKGKKMAEKVKAVAGRVSINHGIYDAGLRTLQLSRPYYFISLFPDYYIDSTPVSSHQKITIIIIYLYEKCIPPSIV